MLAAIDAYFQACHNYPCTFFDEVRFRTNYACGSIPKFLLLALVASVTRLLLDPWFEDGHSIAARLMTQAAWQQILTDILPDDDASNIELVQATGLLSLLDFKSDNHKAGTLKLRIAITVAENLDLNLEPDPSLPLAEQEERVHLFWTLYLMDRVSALVLDRSYLISNDECSVRLPEGVSTVYSGQHSQMTYLNAGINQFMPVSSNHAKMILAMSVLGSVVSFCHGSQPCVGQSSLREDALYSGLISQVDQLGQMLQKDNIDIESSSVYDTRQLDRSSQSELCSAFQRRYAEIAFHIAQILINHPFLLRRHPYLMRISCDPETLHHRLSICQKHAIEILRVVVTAQQAGQLPHTQFYPGWVMFTTAIVHCLFMHSPDMVTAQTSKECFRKAQTIVYDLSLVDGTSQSQRYSIMLEFFGRNAGFASWLVDPSFPMFNHPSKSTSYWRFMDFDWLCEQFCVGTNPLSPVISPSVPASLRPRVDAMTRITSSESRVDNARYLLTPQSAHTNSQNLQEDGLGYNADVRPSQLASPLVLQAFDLRGALNTHGHDSMAAITEVQAESQSMHPKFDPFQSLRDH